MKSPELAVIVRKFTALKLSVIVKEFEAQKVYIGGEVARPGLIPVEGMLRSLDAVLRTGGALDTAIL